MNAEALKQALESWVRVSTWTSSHPLDEERFHKALYAAFEQAEQRITKEEFEQAMRELAAQYHPGILPEYLDEHVDEMAQRAEHISSYVFDTWR